MQFQHFFSSKFTDYICDLLIEKTFTSRGHSILKFFLVFLPVLTLRITFLSVQVGGNGPTTMVVAVLAAHSTDPPPWMSEITLMLLPDAALHTVWTSSGRASDGNECWSTVVDYFLLVV